MRRRSASSTGSPSTRAGEKDSALPSGEENRSDTARRRESQPARSPPSLGSYITSQESMPFPVPVPDRLNRGRRSLKGSRGPRQDLLGLPTLRRLLDEQ